MTKVCPKCFKELSLGSFYKDKTRGNVRPVCKSCTSQAGKTWRASNKEQKSLKDREYRKSHAEEIKNFQKAYYQKNKSRYLANFFKRKAAKLQAIPSWLSTVQLEEIDYLYKLREEVNSLSDYEYEVDHIVPLQGKNVCGLHVPWNLQLLPKEVNRAKSNKF